jgi:type IV pilus assembly protein PilV
MLTVDRLRRGTRSQRGNQRGVGLVEVLVAVVVLSIGMLGVAGLQLHNLRNSESSLERGMAVVETHSVVDAMRADRTNAINGKFNIAIDDPAPTGSAFADVAVAAWRGNLTTLLGPAASGAVACNGSSCAITVSWNDSRGSNGVAAFTVQTQVQL